MINYHVAGKSPLSTQKLNKLAKAISSKSNKTGIENIGVSFVDEATILKLNRSYAGHDYATDVLSFQYNDNPDSAGDIAICTSVAEHQADEHKVSLESELTLLLLHGSLHLLGYDHQTNTEIASMDKLQGDIMEVLGYNYRDLKWLH